MRPRLLNAAIAVVMLGTPALAQEDPAAAMQRLYMEQVQRTQQAEAAVQGNVNAGMQDPAMWAAYQQSGLAGQMSFEAFVAHYQATNGGTPEGMAAYQGAVDQRMGIQGQTQGAMDGMWRAQDGYSAAQQGRWESNDRIADRTGDVLTNYQVVTDPATGQQYRVPIDSSGAQYTDPDTGQTFGVDGNGNYVPAPQ